MTERKSSGRARSRNPWSVPVAIDEIPETGRRVEVAADTPTREAIARLAGVVALPRLQAGFDLTRRGPDGVRVVGAVSATVDQTCIVTLEPIRSEIEETVDLVFTPPVADAADGGKQGALSVDTPEPPEALHNGAVDLGAVATEFLILGINPYPRKQGAVFDAPPAGDPAAHPFAALAALKKEPGGNKR
jgi:uncharacterized metal-binding protein YceD (DUF177 family)